MKSPKENEIYYYLDRDILTGNEFYSKCRIISKIGDSEYFDVWNINGRFVDTVYLNRLTLVDKNGKKLED